MYVNLKEGTSPIHTHIYQGLVWKQQYDDFGINGSEKWKEGVYVYKYKYINKS